MRKTFLILSILVSFNAFSQKEVDIEVYNRSVLCLHLNGADKSNSPVSNIPSDITSWMFIKLEDGIYIDEIEIDFYDRVFRPTTWELRINSSLKTVRSTDTVWTIQVSDTLNTFSINTIDNQHGPTIEALVLKSKGMNIRSNLIHKSEIDKAEARFYYNELEEKLMSTSQNEREQAENFYRKRISRHLDKSQRLKFEKLFDSYQNDYNYKLNKLTIDLAKETKYEAGLIIEGNKYNDWSKSKRIRKGKKAYSTAAKLYSLSSPVDYINKNDLIYETIFCLNQAEKFNKSEKLLLSIIDNKEIDEKFFSSYFSTKKRESRAKELRENGFLYYSCGGSPDAIDSELYYTAETLNNASTLFQENRYELLLEYLKHSSVRINWSQDVRLNRINEVICQMIIKSLLINRTIEEVEREFESAIINFDDFDFNGIGHSLNYPKASMNLFELPLKLYEDNPSYAVKYIETINEKPIIDFKKREEIKSKTIIRKLIDELLSITLDPMKRETLTLAN